MAKADCVSIPEVREKQICKGEDKEGNEILIQSVTYIYYQRYNDFIIFIYN